jgi:hypothetical protein
MDVSKILAALRLEREKIEESILSLERVAAPRRGRAPAWMRTRKRSGSPDGSGRPAPRRRRPNNPSLEN